MLRSISGQEVVNFLRCLVGKCGKLHVVPKSDDVI
jgi:hypothetical protein